MGFNYLQTDDRDDYFSQFGRRRNRDRLKPSGFTLISPSGETLFNNVDRHKVRTYCKKTYLPYGKGAKYIWRGILESKGYKVITEF